MLYIYIYIVIYSTYMLLTLEKGVRGGIFHAIHRYAKTNNKYMKDYHKNKKFSYLNYLDVNNLNG